MVVEMVRVLLWVGIIYYFSAEEEFVWCYKDPKCDQFAWNKNVPVSCKRRL